MQETRHLLFENFLLEIVQEKKFLEDFSELWKFGTAVNEFMITSLLIMIRNVLMFFSSDFVT